MIYINYKWNVKKSGRAHGLLLLLLLHMLGWKLPDIGSYQEGHHPLIALLHGEQLRDLQVSASARTPSCCNPHLFQSVFCWSLLRLQWWKRCSHVWATVLPPPLHCQHSSASQCQTRFRYIPKVHSHWRVSTFQWVEPGYQWCRTIHWDGSLAPRFAF